LKHQDHREKGSIVPWTVYNREGQRKYLTSPEIDAFLEASASFSEDIETFGGILTYTGCRISEALTMTAENIDFVAGMIIIRSLKKRGKTIFRAIPVPAQFLARLRRWLNTLPSGQEFLWPWSRMTGYRYICKVMDKARVSGAFATPKGLRHGFGVKAIQSGFRSPWCNAGWVTPTSRPPPSTPVPSARKNARSPRACGVLPSSNAR
jgi:integrase